MNAEHILTLIIALLEDCLQEDCAPEELRAKIRAILRLLGATAM